MHTYIGCPSGPVVIPGWGWLNASSPGMICIVGHPAFGYLEVMDCNYDKDSLKCVFGAGVYGAVGDDPCGPSAIGPASWSRIKALFTE